MEMVAGRPRPRLSPLIADYTGYRIESAGPGVHRGLHLHLTPLGSRVLLGLPAGELATTVVNLETLLGPVAPAPCRRPG